MDLKIILFVKTDSKDLAYNFLGMDFSRITLTQVNRVCRQSNLKKSTLQKTRILTYILKHFANKAYQFKFTYYSRRIIHKLSAVRQQSVFFTKNLMWTLPVIGRPYVQFPT